MPDSNEKDECKCGNLARVTEDPTCQLEFDPRFNEYHFVSRHSIFRFCEPGATPMGEVVPPK